MWSCIAHLLRKPGSKDFLGLNVCAIWSQFSKIFKHMPNIKHGAVLMKSKGLIMEVRHVLKYLRESRLY